MNETVYHKGKLTEVKSIDGETLLETAKRILSERKMHIEDCYNGDYLQYLLDLSKHVVIDNKLYLITMTNQNNYEEIYLATKNDDGTIDFELRYDEYFVKFSDAIDIAISNV